MYGGRADNKELSPGPQATLIAIGPGTGNDGHRLEHGWKSLTLLSREEEMLLRPQFPLLRILINRFGGAGFSYLPGYVHGHSSSNMHLGLGGRAPRSANRVGEMPSTHSTSGRRDHDT